jgi:hypothetical protein
VRTIYLDHNIVHYFVRSFPKNYDEGKERAALLGAIANGPAIRFVVGAWNVVEAALECAGGNSPGACASEYADFFEMTMPIFVGGHDTLQRAEMSRLALGRWQRVGEVFGPTWMFATHFSQIVAARVKDILVGFDLRVNLLHLATTPASLAKFDQPRRAALAALKATIDSYNRKEYFDSSVRQSILRDWFLALMPERDGRGQWIDISLREELAHELSTKPEIVFASCPAIAVESILTDLRAGGGGRVPRDTDSVDLLHAIPALAYCDAFVVNDKNLRDHAKRTCRAAGRAVVVEAQLSEVMVQLWLKG